MGNGSSKRGDALSDHRRDEWAKRKAALEQATERRERAAAAREAAIAAEVPPDYANERDSEPSYRIAVSEPGRRVSAEGDDATEVARALAELEGLRPSRVRVANDTPVPPSWRSNKHAKLVGAVLALLTALGGLLQALRELGVFGP
jgi:hypothetical protein